MAQNDFSLADQPGLTFLSDVNSALQALASNSSGATEPSTTYAYQFWADTTTGLLKIRNAANNAWVTVGTLASDNLGLVPQTYAANLSILANTSDGSDNLRAGVGGGGALADTRGALLVVYGNEHANTGQALLRSGDVSGAYVSLESGTSIARLTRDGGFDLRSTDVAHGLSDAATSVFAWLQKDGSAGGGLKISGYVDDGTATTVAAVRLEGVGNEATGKTTAAPAILMFNAYNHDGTATKAALGSNANLAAFANGTTVRFILDGDGDSHQDVGTAWTNFDTFDDIALLNALSGELTRRNDPLKANFAEWIGRYGDVLQKNGIVTLNKNGHHFINWSRTHMLVIGALRQIAERVGSVEQRLLRA